MQKRVRGILIENEIITLIKRAKNGEIFYVFPGGGVEKGETEKQALRREMKEELGLDVSVKKFVAEHSFGESKSEEYVNLFYICKKEGGKLGTGCGPEYAPDNGYEGTHEPVQLPFNKIMQLDLRPASIQDLIYKKYLLKKRH